MTGNDVIGQMLAVGLEAPPAPLDLTGRVRRWGPKKAFWYKLTEQRTNGGTYVVVGAFGNWKGQERHRVAVDWRGISQEERDELQARRQAQAQADAAKRKRAADLAAMTAAQVWSQAERTGSSAYLARKGVQPEACRFLPDGALVVPLLRYDEPREAALKAVQIIQPDGTKRFTRGFAKTGCSVRLGHAAVGDPVLVCEGYATGLSLRMGVAQRFAVFVALDAGNLLPVVELVRQLYPRNPILVCADDDWRTAGNPGRAKAWEAARAVARCMVTYPIFRPGTRGPKDTDFNDLHLREGLHMLQRQLRMVLPVLGQPCGADQRAA